jgi:hypothetical protein
MNAAIYRPTDQEIGYLTQLKQMPGYSVLERIFLSELDLMQVAFMNVEAGEQDYEKKLAAKHALAKGGAQFYAQVCEKVESYIARLGERNTQPLIQADPTESLLDY